MTDATPGIGSLYNHYTGALKVFSTVKPDLTVLNTTRLNNGMFAKDFEVVVKAAENIAIDEVSLTVVGMLEDAISESPSKQAVTILTTAIRTIEEQFGSHRLYDASQGQLALTN